MKNKRYLFLIVLTMEIFSCKTQYELKRRVYQQVSFIDTKIDSCILKKFSKLNKKADSAIKQDLQNLNTSSDSIKNKSLRQRVKLYIAYTGKIIVLHQDETMNYGALGGVLVAYTKTATDIKSKLASYKK
jgi:hypothetical protein